MPRLEEPRQAEPRQNANGEVPSGRESREPERHRSDRPIALVVDDAGKALQTYGLGLAKKFGIRAVDRTRTRLRNMALEEDERIEAIEAFEQMGLSSDEANMRAAVSDGTKLNEPETVIAATALWTAANDTEREQRALAEWDERVRRSNGRISEVQRKERWEWLVATYATERQEAQASLDAIAGGQPLQTAYGIYDPNAELANLG